jgi:hypothetical protein
LVNHSFFLLRARTGHARDHIIQSHQEETEEENAEKQFRLSVHEEEETQRKNDYDNRMVLSKGNNAVHKSSKIHRASLLKTLYHIVSIRAALKNAL